MSLTPVKTPVTRGQLGIVSAILLGIILLCVIVLQAKMNRLELEVHQTQAEQRKYNAGQAEILDGVKKIHNDIELFTAEIVEAKRQENGKP